MNVENWTGHDLNMPNGRVLRASGCVRLFCRQTDAGDADGIPVTRKEFERDVNHPLPPQCEGTLLVVSALVANHYGRDDLVAPETARDADGRVHMIGLVRCTDRADAIAAAREHAAVMAEKALLDRLAAAGMLTPEALEQM